MKCLVRAGLRRNAAPLALAAALAGGLAACSPKPGPSPAAPAPASVPAQATAIPDPAVAAAKPARRAHMICRSSRDGRVVPCGTSDAMMVGIKED